MTVFPRSEAGVLTPRVPVLQKLKFDQYHKFEIYLSLPGEDVHELPKEYTLRKVITVRHLHALTRSYPRMLMGLLGLCWQKLAPQSEGNDLVLTYRLPKNF